MIDKIVTQKRDDTVDDAIPEFMAEMVDDMEYIPKNERLGRASRLKRKHRSKWLLTIASGALVLIVVLAIAFDNEEKPAGGAAGSPEAGIVRIEKRLEALETKIALMEKSMRSDPYEKKSKPTSKPGNRYHTVRPGDNLSAIASKYGITVDRLCRLNRLTIDQPIKPDQKLLVSSRN
jgi:LysM repeat protein